MRERVISQCVKYLVRNLSSIVPLQDQRCMPSVFNYMYVCLFKAVNGVASYHPPSVFTCMTL